MGPVPQPPELRAEPETSGSAEVCRAVEEAWRSDPERIGIAQAEGFIRRSSAGEYMRASIGRRCRASRNATSSATTESLLLVLDR